MEQHALTAEKKDFWCKEEINKNSQIKIFSSLHTIQSHIDFLHLLHCLFLLLLLFKGTKNANYILLKYFVCWKHNTAVICPDIQSQLIKLITV